MGQRRTTSGKRHTANGRGFTIMEMMLVLLVIFVIMGLLLGGMKLASKSARRTADAATVSSLKQAVTQFELQMGFVPPFVWDRGYPLGSGGPLMPPPTVAPRVLNSGNQAQMDTMRTQPMEPAPDWRFSIYSLPYYVLGVLDMSRDGTPTGPPVDGVPGPGFRATKPDGSFQSAGRTFQPFFDVSRNANAVFSQDAAAGKTVLRDRNGVAYRYYRWERSDPLDTSDPNDPLKSLNVPLILGLGKVKPQPGQPMLKVTDIVREFPEFKTARYAIVGAGPNGVFGNEDQIQNVDAGHPQALSKQEMANKVGLSGDVNNTVFMDKVREAAAADNIVEIGR
jgi:competence protein ComGC